MENQDPILDRGSVEAEFHEKNHDFYIFDLRKIQATKYQP